MKETAIPPPVAVGDSEEEGRVSALPSDELAGQPLLSGYVRLYPAEHPRDEIPVEKVWLVATDLALHVRSGRGALNADDVISVGAVEASAPPPELLGQL